VAVAWKERAEKEHYQQDVKAKILESEFETMIELIGHIINREQHSKKKTFEKATLNQLSPETWNSLLSQISFEI